MCVHEGNLRTGMVFSKGGFLSVDWSDPNMGKLHS